ncbi:MAG: chemotaxis protein CheA [Deltaproteobacteria bacterium]
MTDTHKEAFREEARELLVELEASLLELEETPADADLIGRVFRAMHTIKGSGAMFGFDEIASFTHGIETVYDAVRNGKLQVTKTLIDQTLRAGDQIRKMVDAPDDAPVADEQTDAIVQSFRDMLREGADPAKNDISPTPPSGEIAIETPDRETTYRIRFRPAKDIFSSGTNPVLLLRELCELGSGSVVALTEQIPPLSEIDPEACYTAWDVILTTRRDRNAIRDVFIFIEDDCELTIDVIDEEGRTDAGQGSGRIGEILLNRGEIKPEELEKAIGAHKRIGELLVDSGAVGADQVQSALAEQQHIREIREKRQATESAASIRVPAERLDRLVNMVGELVTVQSRLSQLSGRGNDPALLQVAEEVERLTAELRDNTMSIRMLPIGTMFSKFQRLVRDLSAELGKEIVLKTEGAETELDKNVIEKLNDPLVHLIRNCIDHGIEKPAVRRESGKPAQGMVRLEAEHSGANVLIRITDDGAGLDGEAIRNKAIEKGLITPEAVLNEKELFSLILMPGFSTARQVTNVSGRGVGMDVVKRGIDALQGTIDISSSKGAGTVISLKLPLTLAIIDGLLVRIGVSHYIMPLSAIEECVELTRKDVEAAHGKHLAEIRGEIVPYIRLRDQFRIGGVVPEIEQIVTVRIDGQRIGFVVDEVVGGHQTVIKSLGRIYRTIEEVSGATILGDGEVALILDLSKLFAKAESVEKHSDKVKRSH